MTGAILRLHGSWDTDAGRAWCSELPALVAAAPAEAVVYRARNTLVRLDSPTGPVVVKAFGKGKPWRLGLGTSKAAESWDHAVRLLRVGLGTPEPRAAVAATGTDGFYVCDWIDGCRSVWDLHDGTLPADQVPRLAEYIARMHELGVHHRDLTPGNVLLRVAGKEYQHLLIDLNRMQFGPVSLSTGLAALAKLECHGALCEPYAVARGVDVAKARRIFKRLTLIERTTRACKDATRPLRRKVGL